MFTATIGPARQTFPARERVDADLLERMIAEGTVIVDNRRRRPLYFDGRFLAARDLTREQNYFLSRQSDIGRVAGGGVIHGLMVSHGRTATSILIQRGHGITSAGEVLVLDQTIAVELTNITEMQRLDAALGLSRIPSEPSRNRSGLFIIALRPVEFTANPIASYPTSITGTRTIEDGDIVEAVALTLVPYLDQGSNTDFLSRRARVAREIFVNRATRGIPSATLPLAMIALDRGVIRWIDPFMVRREVGAEHGNTIGLGFAPRALREAHLLQYEDHLAEVMALRTTRGLRFAASEHFQCLPPGGHIPAATIDPSDFSQMFFPAEIDVDLSIVPADEVPVLLEESMFLPAIDLTLSGADQDSTSVQILIPVPRERLRLLLSSLTSTTRGLKPAAPGLVARRKPIESLLALRLPRQAELVAAPAPADSVWASALVIPNDRMLWYVRRRNLQYKSEFVGTEVRTAGEESEAEKKLIEQLKAAGVKTRFDALSKASTTIAKAELVTFLDSPKFASSKLMTVAAVRELEDKIEKDQQLERNEVLTVEDRFADAQAGEGIRQLENLSGAFKDDTIIKILSETLLVPGLDRLVRPLTPDVRDKFAKRLLDVASGENIGALAEFISKSINEGVEPKPLPQPVEPGGAIVDRLQRLGLMPSVTALSRNAAPELRGEMVKFLAGSVSNLMLIAAVRELETSFASTQDFGSTFKLVTQRYSEPQAGLGVAQLERTSDKFRDEKIVFVLTSSVQMIPEIDRIARSFGERDKEKLTSFSEQILKLAETSNLRGLVNLVRKSDPGVPK